MKFYWSLQVVLLDLEALAEISSNPVGQAIQGQQPTIEGSQRETTCKDKKDKSSKPRSTDTRQLVPKTKTDNHAKLSKGKLVVEYESRHGLNVYFTKFMISLLDMFKVDQQSTEPKEREYFIIRYVSCPIGEHL